MLQHLPALKGFFRFHVYIDSIPPLVYVAAMRAPSIAAVFGLGELGSEKYKALALVYGSSLALMMGVNFIQPVLPALTEPFGISDSALAMIMTVYTGPAIVLAPIFGIIADLKGRRHLLAWGLILFGLSGAAMAFAPTFGWLLAFRAIQGIGFSAVTPLTIILIGDLLEGDYEIGGQGLKVFIDRVGYLILPPLGGLLATIAWFWPFLLYFLAVPMGICCLLWMPETKGTVHDDNWKYLKDILRLTRHPRLMVAFCGGFLRFFLDYGFLTYLPLFVVRTHSVSTATAGLLYVFFSTGAMLTASQAGRIAAGRDKAKLLFIAFLISGIAMVAVPFLPGVLLVGVALFLYGVANGVISPMQKSLLTQNAPAELRGGIISFDRLIQSVSKTLSTTVVGLLLVATNIANIFWMLGVLSFISVALMALLLPKRN